MDDLSFCSREHGLALSRGETPGFVVMNTDFQAKEQKWRERLVKSLPLCPRSVQTVLQDRGVTVAYWPW